MPRKLIPFFTISARQPAGCSPSPEQHDFARNVVLAGSKCHVARSIDDVKSGL
jgi:hypothetical protein